MEERRHVMKLKLTFPIKRVFSSTNYPLMIVDANGITHYWNHEGDYDGYSHDPYIDSSTRLIMN